MGLQRPFQNSLYYQPTHFIEGDVPSVGTPNTTYTFPAGTAYFLDNYNDPSHPTFTEVRHSGVTNKTDTLIGTTFISIILMDKNGNFSESPFFPVGQQRRDYVTMGVTKHLGASITDIKAITHGLTDLDRATGTLNTSGNSFLATGTGLTIKRTAGIIEAAGISPLTYSDPNRLITIEENPISIIYYAFRGSTSPTTWQIKASTTGLQPTYYDDGTTVTLGNWPNGTVGANEWTSQPLFYEPLFGDTYAYFWQGDPKPTGNQLPHGSLSTAANLRKLDIFEENPLTSGLAKSDVWYMRGGVTNLTTYADARRQFHNRYGATF
jgi:hypothetical protein